MEKTKKEEIRTKSFKSWYKKKRVSIIRWDIWKSLEYSGKARIRNLEHVRDKRASLLWFRGSKWYSTIFRL